MRRASTNTSGRARLPVLLTLAFWECGHIEVDRGNEHPCDGRGVCSATYRRVALASEMLAAFHQHPHALPETNAQRLRPTLHNEEHGELIDELDKAMRGEGNLTQIAREIADVLYVTYGTAWAYGIDVDAALGEVHRAAMDKMRDGLRREDGKILKPPDFVAPDMTQAIRHANLET